MRTLLLTTLTAAIAMALTSCGGCGCGATNNDYLRDVPVTQSQQL